MSRRARGALLGVIGLAAAGCGGSEIVDPLPVEPGPAFGPGDWPIYGHDEMNTRTNPVEDRISTASVAAGLRRAWELPGPGVTSTPTVAEGVVYFGAWDGFVYAVRAEDGGAVWSTQVASIAVDASVMVTGERVFVGDGDGFLHALDRQSGAPLWTVQLDAHADTHIYSSAIAIDDLVVIGVAGIELAFTKDDYTFRGSVVALDAASGQERWRVVTTSDDATAGAGVSVWSSASVDRARKMLYIGTGNTYEEPAAPLSDAMLAIRYETGELAWSRQFTAGDVYTIFGDPPVGPDADVGATPNLFAIGDRDAVGVGDKAGVYSVLDRETGETVWARQLTEGSHLGGVMATAAHADGVIYVNSNQWVEVANFENPENTSITFALRAEDGEILWQTPMPWPCFGGLSVANGVLFHGTTDGTLHALDIQDGAEIWSDTMGDSAAGGPSIANGMVLVGHGFEMFYLGGVITGGLIAYVPQ
jgi:polyvinyl alcohol dehydrogenase (cytochrome)